VVEERELVRSSRFRGYTVPEHKNVTRVRFGQTFEI
jgi:hypothetical protein